MTKLVWRLSRDSMESDFFFFWGGGGGGEFMVELVWRLSGNLIYYVFSIKTPEKLHK